MQVDAMQLIWQTLPLKLDSDTQKLKGFQLQGTSPLDFLTGAGPWILLRALPLVPAGPRLQEARAPFLATGPRPFLSR